MSKIRLAILAFFFLPVVCAELSEAEKVNLYSVISSTTNSFITGNISRDVFDDRLTQDIVTILTPKGISVNTLSERVCPLIHKASSGLAVRNAKGEKLINDFSVRLVTDLSTDHNLQEEFLRIQQKSQSTQGRLDLLEEALGEADFSSDENLLDGLTDQHSLNTLPNPLEELEERAEKREQQAAEKKALNERLKAERQKAKKRMIEQQAHQLGIIPEDKSEDGDLDEQQLSDLEKGVDSTNFFSDENLLSEEDLDEGSDRPTVNTSTGKRK